MGMVSAVFTSCAKEELVEPALLVGPDTISATAAERTYSIAVMSNGAWKAAVSLESDSESEWCKIITPATGIDNGTITVSVAENTTISPRKATITVSLGSLPEQVVTVMQEAAANATVLWIDTTPIAATAAADSYSIDVTSNSTWTVTVSSGSEWCKISPTTGIENGTITVNVAKNGTVSTRSAIIIVIAGAVAKTVTVTQPAGDAALSVDKTKIAATDTAASYSIAVTSNSVWTVSSDATWCTLTTKISGINDTVKVNVKENITTSTRKATITITAEAGTKTIIVTQAAADDTSLKFDKASIEATAEADSYSFTVTSKRTWDVESDAEWCTLTTASNKIMVDVAKNTIASIRKATITVTDGVVTKTLLVTQVAAKATLSINKINIPDTIIATAASYLIDVTSNSTWTVSSDAAWCTMTTVPGISPGDGIIMVNVAENTTAGTRKATITVTADGTVAKKVVVTQQAPLPVLTIDKADIAATDTAARYSIAVMSNSAWVVRSDAEWCTMATTVSGMNGTITVNVAENEDITDSRTAIITIITAEAGTTKEITVTQAPAATLELDKTSIPEAIAAAASYLINVTSNSTWAVSSDAEWCSLTTVSNTGTSTGKIMVNVAENTTAGSRKATITVTAGRCKETVTVTQKVGDAALLVDKTAIAATAVAASYSVAVTSNSAWVAESNASWCTLTTTVSGTNGTITVNVEKNPYTYARPETATITITGAVTKTITVTQAAPFTPVMVTVTGGTTMLNGTSVTLSSFQIGKYEVTQKQWIEVMGSYPGTAPSSTYGEGGNYPMYNVSYDDVQAFLTNLNQQTGKNYRLPTEAEWEYAAKGGQSTHNYDYSGSNTPGNVAWYSDNSSGKTHPVGGKAPNELGIYDMSGNVWEWCSDWYGSSYPTSENNPTGAASGSSRVFRGGGCNDGATKCRVSFRDGISPAYRDYYIGFRLVLP
ncbi:hypothetical protein AGMMS49965_22900 [Bacteroidia bacterium]|nr:hypothetical protein AGMMS49965_22900 [Bacteroidia bacterium]